MGKIIDKLLFRNQHTCPWWICFTFDNPVRAFFQNPEKIISPYVKPGMKILDLGPGRGFFTFPMARLAGEKGKVVALDIQGKMLSAIDEKARKYGSANVFARHYDGDNFNLDENFDFINIFWMFHEMKDKHAAIRQIKLVCKRNTVVFFSEPLIHVTRKSFDQSVGLFIEAGFEKFAEPRVFFSRTAAFRI